LGETSSPGRDRPSPKNKTPRLDEAANRAHQLLLRELAWARYSHLSETTQRQGPFSWASCSSRTWVGLRHSRLGETSSPGRDWQFLQLSTYMQQSNSSIQQPKTHAPSFNRLHILLKHINMQQTKMAPKNNFKWLKLASLTLLRC